MSKTSIPVPVRILVASKAAGRCSYRGCNDLLTEHHLTKASGSFSAFAHIVADSPEGPRGHIVRSQELAKSESNIMLLCAKCHKLIDVDDVAGHPEALLFEMKAKHEERIRMQAGVKPDVRTRLLLVSAKVGDRLPVVSEQEARQAVVGDRYPDYRAVVLSLSDRVQYDNEENYWLEQSSEIRRRIQRDVLEQSKEDSINHVSVFAIAPIPLLMVVGDELGDLCDADIRVLLRDPKGWVWDDSASPRLSMKLSEPNESVREAQHVILRVSLTQTATPPPSDVIDLCSGVEFHLYLDEIRADSIRRPEHLRQFASKYRDALTKIRNRFGASTCIHVFASVPNAAAIEMGRVRLPKVDCKIKVFDFNWATRGWSYALTIHRENKGSRSLQRPPAKR